MITFDRVLPELLAACESRPEISSIERACVIRDLRGRVRLVLRPMSGAPNSVLQTLRASLEPDLTTRLGKYFEKPILATTDERETGKIAQLLLDKSEEWTDASYLDMASGNTTVPPRARWRRLERRITKDDWLGTGTVRYPWELAAKIPIVTFYSFKGGVGRTTALVSVALQLAKKGKRIAILDLDLEAPGLGPLLGVTTERGVLDAIVDYVATGSVDLDGLHAPAQALGTDVASLVDVFPAAARLDFDYVEKLARLDYSTAGPWGATDTIPVRKALTDLLRETKRKLRPDWVLLDARAGVHDLSGLSLHGLAHIDVFVTRASEQSYRGLELAVRAHARRKPEDDRLSVTVHSFSPVDPNSQEGAAEIAEVRGRSYQIFSEHAYGDNPPPESDDNVAHSPWQIPRDGRLDHFTKITSVLNVLDGKPYEALLKRIEVLAKPEPHVGGTSGAGT